MRSSSGIISVAANTQKITVDNRISLRYYYRIADNILRQAAIFRAEKNIIDLYVMLLRFSSLANETIPYHRDYRASLQSDKIFLKKKLLSALTELEELKPAVELKLAELSQKHAYQSNGWSHQPQKKLLEPSKSLPERFSVSQQALVKNYTYTINKNLSNMSMDEGSNASNITAGCSKKPKTYNPRSMVWKHFTRYTDEDGKKRALCNYCPLNYSCDLKGSTSNMLNHVPKCERNPANGSTGQSHLAFSKEKDQETGESKVCLQSFRFDQKKGKRAVAEMLIRDELPLKFVENEGFRRFMRVCQPAFVVPSRSTIRRECFNIYLEEKIKLKTQMKTSVHRVSLTTDTWTSLQRINYMCLTAHYIDENWNLQKKVINFCPISSHRGADIGRAVETCLNEWELKNVMTITVDNASSNDVAVKYLVEKMARNDKCLLKGKWTHVRCIAHIMNLVVQDGLKEVGTSVDRIRAAVKWVRQSPARLKRFNEHALSENIKSEKSLILDVPTRWNATYLMLCVAVEYRNAFEEYISEDRVFHHELVEGEGVPSSNDWDNVSRLGCFLRHFYELTLRVSGTKFITSNTYLDSISFMDTVLKQCQLSQDEELSKMAESMTLKFNKYWGDVKKFNLLVFIASLFDPRTKLAYLKVNLYGIYGIELGESVYKLCQEALVKIFNDYKRIHSLSHTTKASSSSSSKPMSEETSSSKKFDFFDSSDDTFRAIRERKMAEVKRQKMELGVTEDSKTELDRYLDDEIEGDDVWFESEDFTVLGWWKKRSPAFPILSLLARDILAIPISTVASESTFSTGGRVLDTFRSSLTPQMVEALICAQNWIRSSGVDCNVEENIEELDKFEEEMRKGSKE